MSFIISFNSLFASTGDILPPPPPSDLEWWPPPPLLSEDDGPLEAEAEAEVRPRMRRDSAARMRPVSWVGGKEKWEISVGHSLIG